PQANRLLASVTPFLIQNIDRKEVHELVLNTFNAFFRRNVLQYENATELSVNLIGSIAYYYRSVLEEAARECGLIVGTIIKSPMEGLVAFHCA
ncbi:MAG: ATPase, partial [Muribaculaceae bacterium]|nr:ATPase [Muribaculaceae bacterium]